MIYLLIFLRGWIIVTLTACNVRQIADGHFAGAFVIGGAISWVWWGNSHNAAHIALPLARHAYAAGAAAGTVTGMFIGGLWKAG